MINFDKLNERLMNEVVDVTFTKVNGDTRKMKATLMESHIPKSTYEFATKTRKKNENNLVVVDIEKNEWRTIRKDSIITVEGE